jgi:antitoxin (DNA-binding transcriptional repressor) of toxin-antitoxin stability system
MKTASVRDVQHRFRSLLGLIAEGESVEVTRNRRIVAWIVPPPAPKAKKVRMPDFLGRMRREYPHAPVSDRKAAALFDDMRGER